MPASLASGSRLGPYEIVAPLGAGGMGEVYRARDPRLGREVAIKVLPRDLAADRDRLRRLEQEARAASALNHPNILTVHELGSHEGTPYVVTELLVGETLRERLAGGSLPVHEAVAIGSQIARGLAAAHERGIIHRDLKPENLFVTRDGVAKILDFGLAKFTRSETAPSEIGEAPTMGATEPGVVLGTVGYMSPEQVRGEPADARSDLFSFGAVLYEMLAGRRAFARGTAEETMTAILREEPPALSEVAGRPLPAGLERVVPHCLEKRPEARFQSARDLAFDLESALTSGAPWPQGFLRRRAPALAGLAALILLAAAAAWVASRPAALDQAVIPASVDSVAVLPFANRSATAEDEYLSDGLTEELINALGKVQGLRVAGRTSSFAFKGKAVDLQEVAQKLSVQTVLEGSVQREVDKVRVRAQLVKVADGYQLWSESYDRTLADIFAIQNEIAQAIAAELRGRLAAGGLSAERRAPAPEAYQLYLKGRHFLQQRTEESMRTALDIFGQAIAADPGFAAAHAGLADAYAVLYNYAYLARDEALPRAAAAARRALDLDPDLAEAHASLGHVLTHQGEWAAAEERLRRALDLDPNNVDAHIWYANLLQVTGRLDQALAEARRAVELDPLSRVARSKLGLLLYLNRDLAEATRQLERVAELAPDFQWAQQCLTVLYAEQAMPEKAIATAQGWIERTRGQPIENRAWRIQLAYAHAHAGRTGEARQLLGALESEPSDDSWDFYNLAMVAAALGERDRAFAHLERWMVETRDASFVDIEGPAWFDPLRDDPRFDRLVEDLKGRQGLKER